MIHRLPFTLAASVFIGIVTWTGFASAAELIAIDRDNIAITQSVRIKPGVYTVKDADSNGVLHVEKDGVEIDFEGATLQTADPRTLDLTKVEGMGIFLNGHKNVTIRNAKVHGYFFNIKALHAAGLKLANCDVSYSRAHRISSGEAPIEIWLGLRSLEEWRNYGGGIWIEASDGSTVRSCRGAGAQNGLLLVDSSKCTVTECDFSYNSGFGVGLWNSSSNEVTWNRIDFVNRPWAGGWGADSAALVVATGSSENFFVGNSMTHSGDGFFLTDRFNGGFSEQNLVTKFDGSCDRNIIAYCDGSWSTANAFEGTFSFGNVYFRNQANDSNFGFWLGYSSDALLLDNEIVRNQNDGIAIEHGHGNVIAGNRITQNRGAAVALWANGPPWLMKLHPSRDSDIVGNIIHKCGRAFRLNGSTSIAGSENKIEDSPGADYQFADRPAQPAQAAFEKSTQAQRLASIMKTKPKTFHLLRDEPGPKGIEWLVPDEYAPRDYRGKLVAWRNPDAATLELLPMPIAGQNLKFVTPEWVEVKPDPAIPGYGFVATVKAQSGPGEVKDYAIEVRSGDGKSNQKITGAFQTAVWAVRWYRWDQPKKLGYDDAAGWKHLFDTKPIGQQATRELSAKLWAKGTPQGVPRNNFALVGSTSVKLDGGRYRLSTLSDDGIRVFLDGQEVVSRWNHHGPTPDQSEVEISRGVHEWTVHYCQEDGASALVFNWQKLAEAR